MKKVIPFKKNILFKTNLSEITSISLEDNLNFGENSVNGNFIVSGDYKMNDSSINTESFSYDLPVEISINEKYDLSKANVQVSDFYYEIINNDTLSVNIEVTLDKLEEIPIIEEVRKENELKEVEVEKTNILEEDNQEIEENLEKSEEIKERCIEPEEDLFKEVETDEIYSSYSVYIVREGDTIESIISKYSIDKDKLQEYNDLKDLKIGDKLIIPNA